MKRTIGYLKTTAVYANSQQVVDKVHMILLTSTLSTFSDKDFVFLEKQIQKIKICFCPVKSNDKC